MIARFTHGPIPTGPKATLCPLCISKEGGSEEGSRAVTYLLSADGPIQSPSAKSRVWALSGDSSFHPWADPDRPEATLYPSLVKTKSQSKLAKKKWGGCSCIPDDLVP